MSSTDIEKKSLEAHVELCAERYASLERNYDLLHNKIENLNAKIERMDAHIVAIREALASSGDKQSKQLIAVGTAVLSVLITGIITLTINFINK